MPRFATSLRRTCLLAAALISTTCVLAQDKLTTVRLLDGSEANALSLAYGAHFVTFAGHDDFDHARFFTVGQGPAAGTAAILGDWNWAAKVQEHPTLMSPNAVVEVADANGVFAVVVPQFIPDYLQQLGKAIGSRTLQTRAAEFAALNQRYWTIRGVSAADLPDDVSFDVPGRGSLTGPDYLDYSWDEIQRENERFARDFYADALRVAADLPDDDDDDDDDDAKRERADSITKILKLAHSAMQRVLEDESHFNGERILELAALERVRQMAELAVAIFSADGEFLGSGLLIGGHHVLTCCHVMTNYYGETAKDRFKLADFRCALTVKDKEEFSDQRFTIDETATRLWYDRDIALLALVTDGDQGDAARLAELRALASRIIARPAPRSYQAGSVYGVTAARSEHQARPSVLQFGRLVLPDCLHLPSSAWIDDPDANVLQKPGDLFFRVLHLQLASIVTSEGGWDQLDVPGECRRILNAYSLRHGSSGCLATSSTAALEAMGGGTMPVFGHDLVSLNHTSGSAVFALGSAANGSRCQLLGVHIGKTIGASVMRRPSLTNHKKAAPILAVADEIWQAIEGK